MLRISGVLLLIPFFLIAQNQPPEISNLHVTADSNLRTMTATFDLSDNESDDVKITVKLSNDGGMTFLANISNMSGDAGFPVTPGTSKSVTFNYDSTVSLNNAVVKIVADDLVPINIQELVDQVDSNNLYNDLSWLQGVRHYIGDSVHLEETKDFIENRFRQSGLQSYRQEFEHVNYNAANIIGRLPGHGDEAKTFIIDGHFDTVNGSPGADDNGSAVVGMLEAMRILSQYSFENSIRFIGFDFEETSTPLGGLTGSITYVSSGIESYETIKGVINFEMIGYYTQKPNTQTTPAGFNLLFPNAYNSLVADSFRGNFITNVADAGSDWLKNAFDSCASAYVPGLKVVSLGIPAGLVIPDLLRSDHASFWGKGINALMITDGANFRNKAYHSANDTLGALNFTFMSNVVKTAVATIAKIAKVQHSSKAEYYFYPASAPDLSYKNCKMQIMPNPSTEFVNIVPGECFQKRIQGSMYNVEGRLVKDFEIIKEENTAVIGISNLNPGVYFIVLKEGVTRAIRQFVVE